MDSQTVELGTGTPDSSPTTSVVIRAAVALAVAGAFGLAVLLAIRPLTSPDLGYHLAYGETFLDTGQTVDHNDFLYTLPGGAGGPDSRPAAGPGCWYDEDGRYRFCNANWLSQVILAAVYRCGGAGGLCLLQAALIAGIFTMMLLAMRRLDLPWIAVAAGIMLAAMTAYMRFNLRPEVFGYLLLTAQLCLLAGRRITWPAAAALIAIQLIFVNVHSYFLLGLALTGAFWAERILRLIHQRLSRLPAAEEAGQVRKEAVRLGAAMLGQVLVCFVNPWTWRLAVLPIQTLIFMHAHNIAGSDLTGGGGHPWSLIGEFFRPFAGAFLPVKSTYAFYVLLILAAAGGLAAAVKRQWACLLVIVGMTAVAISMRRNIAPAALLITPPALAACRQAAAKLYTRCRPQWRRTLTVTAAAMILLASLWFGLAVVTQRFYFNERSPVRFGAGISKLIVPINAAEWLSSHDRPGRLWTDYTSSSNLHFFTAGRPEVPIVTNTWAYPPEVMREVIDYNAGRKPFLRAARKYGITTVALRVDRTTAPLVRQLADDPNWQLVYLGGMHLVFRRISGEGGRAGITADTLDLRAHKAQLGSLDPVAAYALYIGGLTLHHLGWDTAAIDVFAAATAEEPTYHQAWNMQGLSLARRGTRRMLRRDHRGKKDWRKAADCFSRALEIRPNYQAAKTNLALVETQLREISRGVLYAPGM